MACGPGNAEQRLPHPKSLSAKHLVSGMCAFFIRRLQVPCVNSHISGLYMGPGQGSNRGSAKITRSTPTIKIGRLTRVVVLIRLVHKYYDHQGTYLQKRLNSCPKNSYLPDWHVRFLSLSDISYIILDNVDCQVLKQF